MGFGLLVIGTEILTGKRRDGHLDFVIGALGSRGLELDWCRYTGDDPARLTEALRESMSRPDIVFSFGGIGATPDDHTRRCAAEAAGVDLVEHREAAAVIVERFGENAYPQRIRMAHLPAGCTLIPNPVNRIAGFTIGDHHFVPGFPEMGQPMVEWVLDNRYAAMMGGEGPTESLLVLPDTTEGQLIEVMESLVAQFPRVRLSCLPHMNGGYRETELGLRGQAQPVAAAREWLEAELEKAGFAWQRRSHP